MGRRRQNVAAADREMRSALRQHHGMEVEAVNWVRAQHEGEFACLVERFGTAGDTIRWLLDMDSVAGPPVGASKFLDITRIHAGKYAVRIYLRWAA